jgi:CheY-like chemotaxis protein
MMKLLYVDDNPQRLQTLTARLRGAGYEVVTARDGVEALEMFLKQRIDLAVVDYYMTGMGGDVVALEMKRRRSDLPIIVFSGTFTLPEMVIALVDGFVHTGEDPDRLINKIAEILERQKAKIRIGQGEGYGAA